VVVFKGNLSLPGGCKHYTNVQYSVWARQPVWCTKIFSTLWFY